MIEYCSHLIAKQKLCLAPSHNGQQFNMNIT